MARSVIRLEESEIACFHMNYVYMWKKLNTAPYYVSGAGEIPPWIHDEYLLPSYVNLSKCMNPEYVPSVNLVNKIVQFYNANISPAVDTFTFLHERLETTDAHRTAVSASSAAPLAGLYCCYYFSEEEDRPQVRGGMLRLTVKNNDIEAVLVADIPDDGMMADPELGRLLRRTDLSQAAVAEYKKRLPLSGRRISFLRGTGRLTPGMLLMELLCPEKDGLFATVFMPLRDFEDGRFLGCLGDMMRHSPDRTLQFFRVGFVPAEDPELSAPSLRDERLQPLLTLHMGTNRRVTLSPRDNAAWLNYLIDRDPR